MVVSCTFSIALPDDQNAWDNHVVACNFAKYSPILNVFHWETYHWIFDNLFINNPTEPLICSYSIIIIIIIIIIHEYYYGGAVALLLQDHLTTSVSRRWSNIVGHMWNANTEAFR